MITQTNPLSRVCACGTEGRFPVPDQIGAGAGPVPGGAQRRTPGPPSSVGPFERVRVCEGVCMSVCERVCMCVSV